MMLHLLEKDFKQLFKKCDVPADLRERMKKSLEMAISFEKDENEREAKRLMEVDNLKEQNKRLENLLARKNREELLSKLDARRANFAEKSAQKFADLAVINLESALVALDNAHKKIRQLGGTVEPAEEAELFKDISDDGLLEEADD